MNLVKLACFLWEDVEYRTTMTFVTAQIRANFRVRKGVEE